MKCFIEGTQLFMQLHTHAHTERRARRQSDTLVGFLGTQG